MDANLKLSFVQWDFQEARKKEQEILALQRAAWIDLNNLYLAIQSGREKLTVHTQNDLQLLLDQAYPVGDPVFIPYWLSQFERLSGWAEV